jgi:hypothetical protein
MGMLIYKRRLHEHPLSYVPFVATKFGGQVIQGQDLDATDPVRPPMREIPVTTSLYEVARFRGVQWQQVPDCQRQLFPAS